MLVQELGIRGIKVHCVNKTAKWKSRGLKLKPILSPKIRHLLEAVTPERVPEIPPEVPTEPGKPGEQRGPSFW